jgi:hypothetical protein
MGSSIINNSPTSKFSKAINPAQSLEKKEFEEEKI